MAYCNQCGEKIQKDATFCDHCGASLVEDESGGPRLYGKPPPLQDAESSPEPAPSEPAEKSYPAGHVPNHLVKAIIATLCCCMPAGVAGIVYAAQVDGHLRSGDLAAAQESSKKANFWSNLAIAGGFIVVIFYILVGLAEEGAGGF